LAITPDERAFRAVLIAEDTQVIRHAVTRSVALTSIAMLILGHAIGISAMATPSSAVTGKPADRIASAWRVWAYLPAGSFSLVNNASPRVELDAGDLMSRTSAEADVDVDIPFPANAPDFQNWIGADETVPADPGSPRVHGSELQLRPRMALRRAPDRLERHHRGQSHAEVQAPA
jgi:hypothetical protein